jgi:hypothetical protein
MDDKDYKASTHEKFRRILKFYYKVVCRSKTPYKGINYLPDNEHHAREQLEIVYTDASSIFGRLNWIKGNKKHSPSLLCYHLKRSRY